jgi:hypothetical protein
LSLSPFSLVEFHVYCWCTSANDLTHFPRHQSWISLKGCQVVIEVEACLGGNHSPPKLIGVAGPTEKMPEILSYMSNHPNMSKAHYGKSQLKTA